VFTTTTGPKMFTVTLTVTDNGGVARTDQFIVSVNNTPPQVNITSPVKNSGYKVGTDTVYMRQASVTDAEHSGAQLTYEWQTTLVHNNHTHPESIDGSVESATLISRIGCNGDNYNWLVTLTVTDAAGLSTIDSSQIFPNCAGSLPVFLHKFSVTQTGSEHLVKWTTEQEIEIDYYELERSTDGVRFQVINRQVANNTTGTNHYSYADNSFLPGVNYYRLKILERDGTFKYSIIVRTEAEQQVETFRVVPNPVTNDFSLLYSSPGDGVVTIRISDITGRLVFTTKEGVNRGNNVIYMQHLPKWKAGTYFITVDNKGEIKQGKLIKVN
jgi:hypothetical protein